MEDDQPIDLHEFPHWDNKRHVLLAVSRFGMELQHAAEHLRRDHEVVRAAARADWRSLAFVPYDLMTDMDFMMRLAKIEGRCIHYAGDKVLANLDFIRVALQQNGTALQYAPCSVQCDSEPVTLAIRSARRSPFSPLAFADASLRMDMTVVKVAVACNGAALAYAEGAPRTSLEIADIARKSEPMALNNTTEENRRELIATTMSETALPRFALRIYML